MILSTASLYYRTLCPTLSEDTRIHFTDDRMGRVVLQVMTTEEEEMPQNGGGRGWLWDEETGEKVMPPLWQELLEWFLQGPEREPRTQREWATAHDIHEDSLRRIKRDHRFIKEWDKHAADLNINPERVQSVIDSLWQRASDGDVKAASLYLQYIEKFTPRRRVVVEDERDFAGFSDEELASALEAEVRHLRMVESA